MSKNNTDNLIKKHDELSKKFLTDINMAREFLEIHLDKIVVAKWDLKTLTIESGSYIEDDLQKYFSDIVYKVDLLDKTNCAYIYMLIEHQSKAESLMPLRILRYQLSILQKHIDKHKIDGNLPSVVPLVFYNGAKSPYPYATEIRDLFADIDIIDKIPLGTFGLVDLTVMSNDEILKHGKLALLEMVLKHIHVRDFRKVAELIYNAVFIAYRDNIQKSLFDSAVAYLMKARGAQELQPLFEQIITNIENYKGGVMTYAEELRQEGLQKGLREGRQEGVHYMAKELLKFGVEESIVAKASHLSQKELDEIKKSLN